MRTICLSMKLSVEVDHFKIGLVLNVSIFGNVSIFSHVYVSKNLKSIHLSNKKWYGDN